MNRLLALAVPAMASIAAASPILAQGQTCLRYGWVNWRYTCIQWGSSGGSASSVPEINAGAGLLAVAAVAAVVLFVWERRRRAA